MKSSGKKLLMQSVATQSIRFAALRKLLSWLTVLVADAASVGLLLNSPN